ncbi:MAG: 16S rRNA (guanine(527)-N(7))-methyltransferase RsmG [Coraliomargaritaceae bacterium]
MKLAAYQHLFPNISDEAWPMLERWAELLREWNAKINLISRKDIDALEERHLVHCLAITNALNLMNRARVLDVGTGGGLPGLPMAICYPQAKFTLVDSIAKKVGVVQSITDELGLENVEAKQIRAETLKRKYDFVTGRAVKNLPEFLSWIQNNLQKGSKHSLDNGVIYWKGGSIEAELNPLGIQSNTLVDLEKALGDSYFNDKFIIHIKAEAVTGVRFFQK